MTSLMEKFEQQFEDLDVQTSVMDSAMHSTTAGTMPEGQIESLMAEVADEHGCGVLCFFLPSLAAGSDSPDRAHRLELNMELGSPSTAVPSAQAQSNAEQDELSERLARLRSGTS